MLWVTVFGVVFVLVVVMLVRGAIKAGPRQVDDAMIAGGQQLLSVTAAEPGNGWQKLGRLTTANGLNLKFEHNDDPAAEATLLAHDVDANEKSFSRLANTRTIALTDQFSTEHVHTSGYVFQVRLRGARNIVGKEVRIQMVINSKTGEPYGAKIENDDDTDAAVGDWIEIESAQILGVAAA